LNLLLAKEGQSSWVAHSGGRNSRRLDVPLGDPELAMQPGKKYIQAQSEKMIPARQAVIKLAKEAIPQ
jgi:hypothetical protein